MLIRGMVSGLGVHERPCLKTGARCIKLTRKDISRETTAVQGALFTHSPIARDREGLGTIWTLKNSTQDPQVQPMDPFSSSVPGQPEVSLSNSRLGHVEIMACFTQL